MREQTLEYIEILCLQDDGYRRRKKETPIKSFSACLTSQKSAAWGTKKTRIIPLTSKENVFESSTPFICFLLGWIVRDTIDTVVGRLVPISTNKICNCNSYINSWGHKYNTISYWVLWNMFWVYLEHCYLFFTVSLRQPGWGILAFLFFSSWLLLPLSIWYFSNIHISDIAIIFQDEASTPFSSSPPFSHFTMHSSWSSMRDPQRRQDRLCTLWSRLCSGGTFDLYFEYHHISSIWYD